MHRRTAQVLGQGGKLNTSSRASRHPLLASTASRRSFAGDFTSNSSSTDLAERLADLRSRQLPNLYDYLNSMKQMLLTTSTSAFLPAFKGTRFPDTIQARLAPGHHLVYFPTPISENLLLPDGTDLLHAPGGPWSQRLWAGGRVRFLSDIELDRSHYALKESITDVRASGRSGSEKIFVNIKRTVTSEWPSKVLAQLEAGKKTHLPPVSDKEVEKDVLLVEDRQLCFLREEPGGALQSLMKPRPAIAPPKNPDFSHSLVPTSALLFRFSALTFNAHAIHIDPEYTRTVYGLPKLVVHGPLSLVLMLECMSRALEQREIEANRPSHVIMEIEYKNMMPLFVNEEMTICCKREGESVSASGKPCDKWTVWIQKAHSDGQTVAVRGTVLTGTTPKQD